MNWIDNERWRLVLLPLFLLVGAAVAVVLSVAVPPPVSRDEMPGGNYSSGGIFDPRPTVYGLLGPEAIADGTTYQWTTDHAYITFPYMANMGQYADVSLRLASNRADNEAAATVTVSLNGMHFPSFVVPEGFRSYTFTLDTRETPNPYLDPSHIQLDIESTTVVRADGTQVGVAIDSIELRSSRGLGEVVALAIVWAVSLVLVMAVALRRLPSRWAAFYGVATLLTLAVAFLTYTVRPFPPAYEAALVGLAWLVAVLLAPVRWPVLGVGLAGLGLWVALVGRLYHDWQIDDAYISYRYAWNLVHGSGLVYNPGEVPVEGYTNFLWTVLAALPIALGYHPAALMLCIIVVSSIGLLGLTFYLGSWMGLPGWLPLLPPFLLAVDPSYIVYGAKGSGIEAVPFAFLVLMSLALIWREDDGSRTYLVAGGVCLALAALMRPEGIGVFFILIGVKGWQAWRHGHLRRALLDMVLPYLLIVVPYEVWRIAFYGYLFPNTFYAKTGATIAIVGRGLEYTWEFIVDHWLLVALAVGTVFVLVSRRRLPQMAYALGWLVLLYSLYIIAVGGDHFPASRFFVPLVAPMAILALRSAYDWIRLIGEKGRGQLRRVAVSLLALALVAYTANGLWLQRPGGTLAKQTDRENNYVSLWGLAGLWLRDNTPPNTLVASPVAGAIAFYGQRNVVDMLGITDLHIGHKDVPDMGSGLAGHEKGDPNYVFDRKPKYMLPYPFYFDPVAGRLATEYMTTTVTSMVGRPVQWWERRGP